MSKVELEITMESLKEKLKMADLVLSDEIYGELERFAMKCDGKLTVSWQRDSLVLIPTNVVGYGVFFVDRKTGVMSCKNWDQIYELIKTQEK